AGRHLSVAVSAGCPGPRPCGQTVIDTRVIETGDAAELETAARRTASGASRSGMRTRRRIGNPPITLGAMALRGKRIFVTAGGGFTGSPLARRLVADNEAIALANLHRDALGNTDLLEHPNFTLVEGDVLDAEAVRETARGASHIVHCAAIAGVDTVR